MKTYLEVADDVFQKGEACLKQKREQRQKLKERAAFAALTAVILLSAFGITKGALTRKAPVVLPASSNPPETATTAQSGETISTTEPSTAHTSTQNAAPGTRTTNPGESAAATTRAAHGGTASQPASTSVAAHSETTSAFPGETGTKAPTDGPAPTEPTADITASTTEPTEPTAPEPTEPGDEPPTETTTYGTSDRETSTRMLTPGGPNKDLAERWEAAVEDNAYGWLRYQGRNYVQGKRAAREVETGEKLGDAGDFEGNLELLGLAGEVFRIADESNGDCLLLKTSAGRNLIFVPVPDAE